MANLNGNLLTIYISLDGGTTRKLGICMTSGEFSAETNQIDSTSKCGEGWTSSEPGNKSWTFSGEGFAEADTVALNQFSFKELVGLWASGVKFIAYWRDLSGYYRNYSGDAYISSISETANTDELVTFSFELTGTGRLNVPS